MKESLGVVVVAGSVVVVVGAAVAPVTTVLTSQRKLRMKRLNQKKN
uniref:Uncharacterized protein n=1 Tax=Ciona intestinalis TaxID=7719 RepID=F6SQV2_CIOIN